MSRQAATARWPDPLPEILLTLRDRELIAASIRPGDPARPVDVRPGTWHRLLQAEISLIELDEWMAIWAALPAIVRWGLLHADTAPEPREIVRRRRRKVPKPTAAWPMAGSLRADLLPVDAEQESSDDDEQDPDGRRPAAAGRGAAIAWRISWVRWQRPAPDADLQALIAARWALHAQQSKVRSVAANTTDPAKAADAAADLDRLASEERRMLRLIDREQAAWIAAGGRL